MAISKIPKVKDLNAHFFMSVLGNNVDIVYHDTTDNGAGLGAAFASVLEEDERLFNILSTAFIIVLEAKEKYSSKKSNKVPKTPKKAVKKK
jgi:hypothetical protein